MQETATLAERVEEVYFRLHSHKASAQLTYDTLRDLEEEVKLDHFDEWASAKNNDVRYIMVLRWINEDLATAEAYHIARKAYREARNAYRLAVIDARKLELLATLA